MLSGGLAGYYHGVEPAGRISKSIDQKPTIQAPLETPSFSFLLEAEKMPVLFGAHRVLR